MRQPQPKTAPAADVRAPDLATDGVHLACHRQPFGHARTFNRLSTNFQPTSEPLGVEPGSSPPAPCVPPGGSSGPFPCAHEPSFEANGRAAGTGARRRARGRAAGGRGAPPEVGPREAAPGLRTGSWPCAATGLHPGRRGTAAAPRCPLLGAGWRPRRRGGGRCRSRGLRRATRDSRSRPPAAACRTQRRGARRRYPAPRVGGAGPCG